MVEDRGEKLGRAGSAGTVKLDLADTSSFAARQEHFLKLAEAHLDQSGLAALGKSLAQIGRGRRFEVLCVEMAEAVAANEESGIHAPGKLRELFLRISPYRGAAHVLESFLNAVSPLGGELERDPFRAATQARFNIVFNPREMPADLREQIEDQEQADQSGSKIKVKSASGQFLTDVVILVRGPREVSSGILPLGERSFNSLFFNFPPGTLNAPMRKELTVEHRRLLDLVTERIKPTGSAAREEHGAEELPWLERDKRSLIEELNLIIARARAEADRAVYGATLLASEYESFHVRSDVGAGFWNWHRRRIETQPDQVSPAVRVAFAALDNPVLASMLPQSERITFMTALHAEYLLHSYADKKGVLSDIEADFNWLSGLEEAERELIRSLYGDPHAALAEVRETLSHGASELNLIDLIRITDREALRRMRAGENQAYLEKQQGEITESLQRFEPFFIQNDALREDCRSEEVPKRLSISFPGLTLTREDWAMLKRAVTLWRVSGGDQEKIALALSIPQFREMIDGVLIANRKVKFLEDQFRAKGFDVAAEMGEESLDYRAVVEMRGVVATRGGIIIEKPAEAEAAIAATPKVRELEAALNHWSPVLLRTNKIELARMERDGVDLAEASRRYINLVERPKGKMSVVAHIGAVGLCRDEDRDTALELVKSLAQYRSARELGLEDDLVKARGILNSPLIAFTSKGIKRLNTRNYFLPEEKQFAEYTLRLVAEAGDKISVALERYGSERIADLREELQDLGGPYASEHPRPQPKRRRFFTGALVDTSSGRRLDIFEQTLDRVLHQASIALHHRISGDKGEEILVRDPAAIERAIGQIRDNFKWRDASATAPGELSAWLEKARSVTSRRSEVKLRQINVLPVTPLDWMHVSGRRGIDLERDMISRELYAAITALYDEAKLS